MTSTVKACSEVSPEESVATYVIVVVPTGNWDPEEWLGINDAMLQLSSAIGSLQVTVALQSPASATVVMLAGTPDRVGGWISFTVTRKDAAVLFPLKSVAV